MSGATAMETTAAAIGTQAGPGGGALPEAEPATGGCPPPALLHNMCARPRTEVAFEVPPVDSAAVARFLLPEGVSLSATRAETTEANLDSAWADYGLTGAALVFPWSARHAVVHDRALTATDRMLVVNVLARARAAVLLASAPAVLDSEYLGRDLASDDPRLVALVEATGAARIGRS
jgi:hypothetical protein